MIDLSGRKSRSVEGDRRPVDEGRQAVVGDRRPVVFCDFDGTITENDNIVEIMKHFQPEGWKEIVEQILSRELSIQEGVGQLFALYPTSMKKEITDFTLKQARIRDGFENFLGICQEGGIEFFVTSGGIDFFVHPILAPFSIPDDRIYCNGSDFGREQIRITWPYSCDEHCANQGCGMCKGRIMRQYPEDQYFRIVIGDSVTDLEAAKLADLVFARSHLADYCAKNDIPYIAYETFHEIGEYVQREVVRQS